MELFVHVRAFERGEHKPLCSGARGRTGSVWSRFMGSTSYGLWLAPELNRISTLKRCGLSTGTLRP